MRDTTDSITSPTGRVQLSIVIPIHNEKENIGRLLKEIIDCLARRYEYEIVCVDDHSTDRSGDSVMELAEHAPQIRCIRLDRQCGQSGALRKGVKVAHHSLIISLDGDGQNDPADIHSFVDIFLEKQGGGNNFLLIGHRTKRRDSAWRKLTSRIANSVRNAILGDDTPDSGCGIKAFDRQMYLDLPAFNHMHRFLPVLVKRNNGNVVSVPVRHRPRLGGSSKYGTVDRLCAGVIDMLGVRWLQQRAIHGDFFAQEDNDNE